MVDLWEILLDMLVVRQEVERESYATNDDRSPSRPWPWRVSLAFGVALSVLLTSPLLPSIYNKHDRATLSSRRAHRQCTRLLTERADRSMSLQREQGITRYLAEAHSPDS